MIFIMGHGPDIEFCPQLLRHQSMTPESSTSAQPLSTPRDSHVPQGADSPPPPPTSHPPPTHTPVTTRQYKRSRCGCKVILVLISIWNHFLARLVAQPWCVQCRPDHDQLNYTTAHRCVATPAATQEGAGAGRLGRFGKTTWSRGRRMRGGGATGGANRAAVRHGRVAVTSEPGLSAGYAGSSVET